MADDVRPEDESAPHPKLRMDQARAPIGPAPRTSAVPCRSERVPAKSKAHLWPTRSSQLFGPAQSSLTTPIFWISFGIGHCMNVGSCPWRSTGRKVGPKNKILRHLHLRLKLWHLDSFKIKTVASNCIQHEYATGNRVAGGSAAANGGPRPCGHRPGLRVRRAAIAAYVRLAVTGTAT